MPRIKRAKELLAHPHFRFEPEDARFGTPVPVADWRAKRLSCAALAEIGCGVGFQTAAFAKTCKKVLAVELDPRKAALARANMKALGLRNVEVLCGDALAPDVIEKVRAFRPSVIFCDTERAPSEESRSLASISPDPRKLLAAYSPVAASIAVEVPPHLNEFPDGCEREYLSLHGALNRLTLYFGKLKECDVCAVFLPQGTRIEKSSVNPARPVAKPAWFYELDPTAVRAGIVDDALAGTGAWPVEIAGKVYALGPRKVSRPWLTGHRILATSDSDIGRIRAALKEAKAKSVILRVKVDPKMYWKERAKYEAGLEGTKTVHLFVSQRTAYITGPAER